MTLVYRTVRQTFDTLILVYRGSINSNLDLLPNWSGLIQRTRPDSPAFVRIFKCTIKTCFTSPEIVQK